MLKNDLPMNINPIAESLGYKHATYFSAVFINYQIKWPNDFR